LILSGYKKGVTSHQNREIVKARRRDFREFVCGRLTRHGFIAYDARKALEGRQAAYSTPPRQETDADCKRDDWGSAIAPNQSARFTRNTRLITFEKALKNV
jgi:hypothetical protein